MSLCAAWSVTTPRTAEANDFGIGLVLGEPTGLSMQYLMNDRNALNFALGLEIIDDGPNDRLYFHLDYAFFLANLVSAAPFDLPFYIGIGGFFVDTGDPTIGARMPFGVEMQFKGAPVNIFAELGLRLAVIDDVDLDIVGAIGVRVYF